MRRFLPILASIALALPGSGQTTNTTSAPINPTPLPDEHSTLINTAIVPTPKLEKDSYDWWQRHTDELAARDRIHPQIVLIGDSITHFWGGAAITSGPRRSSQPGFGIKVRRS